MKQPLFSTSYAPRDGESTLDEIESPKNLQVEIFQGLSAIATVGTSDNLVIWQFFPIRSKSDNMIKVLGFAASTSYNLFLDSSILLLSVGKT